MRLSTCALLFISLSAGNSIAQEEKEGDWWYIYKDGDVVGAYSDDPLQKGAYKISCGSPRLPVSANKYIDTTNHRSFLSYPTKVEARSAIATYCKKR